MAAEWSIEAELLATIAELVDANTRLFYAAHKSKSAPMPAAIEIPRPHSEQQPKKDPLAVVRALAGISRVRYAPGPQALPPASSN